jgi:hypothetical protein
MVNTLTIDKHCGGARKSVPISAQNLVGVPRSAVTGGDGAAKVGVPGGHWHLGGPLAWARRVEGQGCLKRAPGMLTISKHRAPRMPSSQRSCATVLLLMTVFFNRLGYKAFPGLRLMVASPATLT